MGAGFEVSTGALASGRRRMSAWRLGRGMPFRRPYGWRSMRLLHTSDWHVGKTLKGRPRLDEHRAVLREIVQLARREQVDAVLIAGDLYDSAAPNAATQQLVVGALLALADTGARVIAIAGNHDHAATLDAYRPLAAHAGITLVGAVRPADRGGVIRFRA